MNAHTPPARMTHRSEAIDIMKGILVIGMLYSHVTVFYGTTSFGATILKTSVNAVSFSGFLFCFGYAFYAAYLQREHAKTRRKIFLGSLHMYGAFVLSSYTYSMFRDKVYGWERFFDILTLHYIPLYCEFLLTFGLLYLISPFLLRAYRWCTATFGRLVGTSLLCLIPTFFPLPYPHTVLGILWGVHGVSLFPLLPYVPFFLGGIAVARGMAINRWHIWLFCFAATGLAIGYGLQTQSIPGRFPPTIWWLMGPALPISIYLSLSQRLAASRNLITAWFANIGANVLFYLVMSNIALFAFTRAKYGFSLGGTFLVTLALLLVIRFITGIVRPPQSYYVRD
jgi:uncharacterized membrane protein